MELKGPLMGAGLGSALAYGTSQDNWAGPAAQAGDLMSQLQQKSLSSAQDPRGRGENRGGVGVPRLLKAQPGLAPDWHLGVAAWTSGPSFPPA